MLKVSNSVLWISVLLLTSCATGSKSSQSSHPHESKRTWTEGWSTRLDGFVSDLNISVDGSSILLATVPDSEADAPNPQVPLITTFNQAGQKLWSKKTAPVRAQTLSDDGKLVLTANHGDQLVAMDSLGKELWSVNATCRPLILPGAQKILCYHDEDAESDIAFDIFDLKGKKLLSYPVSSDVLTLKLSRDKQNILLGLTHGEMILIGPDFKTKWKRKLNGEIVDLAVSDGKEPTAAVLYDQAQKKTVTTQRSLGFFDSSGKLSAEQPLAGKMEKLEFTSPDSVLLYGNSPGTTVLAQYSKVSGKKALTENWNRVAESYASYSSNFFVSEHYAIIGFDDIESAERHSHARIFDFNGQLLWDIPLLTRDGSYLYVHDFSESARLLAIGMDDGSVKTFRLE
ncbi:MAG: hypothetical protein A2X97_07510 [Bdellovibrionales bacterium GWA1_52_35]|nr:MAG: hypothetical protein A2X97_07510 [Bdellovibrionales bacterium GWA1_52_35]HCM41345.1 hypothetical protein [Bdellovibrionales bacterium]